MGKKSKLPPGTWLQQDVMESQAYNALKGWASQLLTHFLRKRWFDNMKVGKKEKKVCTNCDSIPFTQIEANRKYGITQPRFNRAIDQLLAKGFISIKHQGGACQGDKSIYALVDIWQLWRPGAVFEVREQDPVERGFRKPKKQK